MRKLGLIILICAAVVSAAAECSQADKKALAEFDAAWSKAGQTGDKASLMAIYADDYVGFPGMQSKTATIDATMRTFERNKANPAGADKVASDHYFISCTPNTATITHRNTIWTPEGTGGKPETFYARSVHFLEKRGGKWQVVSNAGNDLDEYSTLWYLEQDWNDAILKKDKAWFEKNYAADFTSISSASAKLMNRAEDISDAVDFKGTMELAETTGMNIRIDRNFAIVTGVFRTKGKDEKGVAFDRKVRYTDTWIKRDGRWQAWSSQGTAIPETENIAQK
ncbi:MAG TPA: nuclear transport factor 2 family protein [Pyrinomonadaceae bacterium]